MKGQKGSPLQKVVLVRVLLCIDTLTVVGHLAGKFRKLVRILRRRGKLDGATQTINWKIVRIKSSQAKANNEHTKKRTQSNSHSCGTKPTWKKKKRSELGRG
jgi:hypothetical protein